MRHRWFTLVRLSNPYMTCLTTPFNRNVHYLNVSAWAAYGCLKPAPVSRLRRAFLHLGCSIAFTLRTRSWHNVSLILAQRGAGTRGRWVNWSTADSRLHLFIDVHYFGILSAASRRTEMTGILAGCLADDRGIEVSCQKRKMPRCARGRRWNSALKIEVCGPRC